MKKVPTEEKIFIGLIISQIILMLFAINFMTGAARPRSRYQESTETRIFLTIL